MNRTPPPATTPSFEKSAKPLLLALKPSRSWFIFLLALHTLAAIAIVIAAIPLPIKLLLLLSAIASLIYHLKQQSVKTQLVWRNGNRWFVDDEQSHRELRAIDFFSRWLVIFSLSGAHSGNSYLRRIFTAKRKYVIPFDAVDEDTFRLLRVRLRIEGYELLNPPEEDIK